MKDVDFLVDYLSVVSMKTSGKTRVSIDDLALLGIKNKIKVLE